MYTDSMRNSERERERESESVNKWKDNTIYHLLLIC